jgi:tetratricopeptide (TPR) repeat protein
MKVLIAMAAVTVGIGFAADVHRGIELYQQGKFKEAEAELSSVVSSDHSNANAYRYLSYSRIELKKLSEAEDAAAKAKEAEANGETNTVWARLYTERKDYAKAEESLADAAGPEVDYVRGRLDLARGKNQEAAKEFEDYLKDNPENAYAHYYAGMAYNGMRRQDKMLSHFELFVKMKPDAPEAKKVRAVLQTGR